jgi:hypothetical protein
MAAAHRKSAWALDTQRRDGNMVEQTSLERLQVYCKWERSVAMNNDGRSATACPEQAVHYSADKSSASGQD